ncbi:MAG: recombinase family protein [Lachnospiraceae bacterium]|nr:recombinase family protein [Lachnospiraceae bacterium]
MIYGYARVSTKIQATDGNSLEAQSEALRNAGATEIFSDTYTGATTDRPELKRLLAVLKKDDVLVLTKLDRIARTARQGLELIDTLNANDVSVRILNMGGAIDNTPIGKLMRTMLFAFAEFERDLIVERTQEGKRIARQNPDFHEGRPKKFTEAQINHALSLRADHSFKQISRLTGISVSTLKRADKAKKKAA